MAGVSGFFPSSVDTCRNGCLIFTKLVFRENTQSAESINTHDVHCFSFSKGVIHVGVSCRNLSFESEVSIYLRNKQVLCPLCDTRMDAATYPDHVATCGSSGGHVAVRSELKVCALCGKEVQDLVAHYQTCSGDNPAVPEPLKHQPNTSLTPVNIRAHVELHQNAGDLVLF